MENKGKSKSKSYKYSFGVPTEVIWSTHILMGVFFVYIGYELIMHKKIPEYMALIIAILGALALFYHLHLWYESASSKGST